VNEDGSLSRITNWPQMTDREREVTQRRIAKRNTERRNKLLARLPLPDETGGDVNSTQ
jgi:predicted Fe-S protein YdhL (DUF1289 family)